MSERKSIPNYIRFQVFKRDKFTCQYCGKAGGELEVDHIEPISKGGTNDIDNLITACKDCNRGKRDIPVLPIGHIIVKEPKSRRTSLLIRPSIFDAIKKMAEDQQKSINDFINDILEKEVYQNYEE